MILRELFVGVALQGSEVYRRISVGCDLADWHSSEDISNDLFALRVVIEFGSELRHESIVSLAAETMRYSATQPANSVCYQ